VLSGGLSLWAQPSVQASPAGLTIRRSVEVKLGSIIPPEHAEAIKKQVASALPNEFVIRIKGDKMSSALGAVTVIQDNNTDQITLLNPKTKKFAEVSTLGVTDQTVHPQLSFLNLAACILHELA
jgi:hypothetical protein